MATLDVDVNAVFNFSKNVTPTYFHYIHKILDQNGKTKQTVERTEK